MRAHLIAASIVGLIVAGVPASAQSIEIQSGTATSIIDQLVTSADSIVVTPLPCPTQGECPNPWADQ